MNLLADDVTAAALADTLDALRRGSRRSRLRILVVVCPAGHTLLEVFPTRAGPVALWRFHTVQGDRYDAERMDDDSRPESGTGVCRCTEQAPLDLDAVAEHLAAGVRRVVISLP